MGRTSNTAKQHWNAEHYAQIKVSVKPEIASAFKLACNAANVSMASVLSNFMKSYPYSPVKRDFPMVLTSTRRHRRNSLRALLALVEQIRAAEERYRDSIPENLAASSVYDIADESVSLLSDGIDILASAYH